MPADTTRYSFPYQTDTDAPDGPALGEDLATAIETSLGAVDDRVVAIEALGLTRASAYAEDASNNAAPGIAATGTPSNGTTTCGATFIAPPSGKVQVSVNVSGQIGGGTGQGNFGPMVRQGASIGSGTIVSDPSADPGCKIGTTGTTYFAGSASRIVTGLTPGTTYNVTCVMWTTGTATLQYYGRSAQAVPMTA